MVDFLFDTSNSFQAYTIFHWVPLLMISSVMILSIYWASKYLSNNGQRIFGTALSLIPAICVLGRMVFTWIDGTFSIQEELPLHLCRTLGLMFPFIMYWKSKKWFGITYFFTIVGTLQALLTPDLPLSFPHHSYWTYWLLHTVLVFLPIYAIVVYKFRIGKRDFINAIIAGNVYLLITGVVNAFIGSNYFFTSHKPPFPTLLDMLGPWPWYIFAVEMFSIVMFVIVAIPFWVSNRTVKMNTNES